MLDHCFGAGKTSLVFKFRKVLSENAQEQGVDALLKSELYQNLQRAIYLHINFKSTSFHSNLPISIANRELDIDAVCDHLVLVAVHEAVAFSLQRADVPDFLNAEKALLFLESCIAPDVKFLFHFDDVGSFEQFGDVGIRFLCRLWSFAESLRANGHFYVLTGRSTWLYLLGKNEKFQGRPGSFQSPTYMVLIPLELLSRDSVLQMFRVQNDSCAKFADANIDALMALTAGVPRTVTAIIAFFKSKGGLISLENSHLERAVAQSCAEWHQDRSDQNEQLFRTLVELSWAGICFDSDCKIGAEQEPITSAIARLGAYRLRVLQTAINFVL